MGIRIENAPQVIPEMQSAVKENGILAKIYNIVKLIFEKIKEIILFPIRYFGGKSEGYHWHMQKKLSADEVLPFIFYGALGNAVHVNNVEWIKPFGYTLVPGTEMEKSSSLACGTLEATSYGYFDQNTGLKIMLVEKDDEIVVAFGANDSSRSVVNNDALNEKIKSCIAMAVTKNYLGGVPELFKQADVFVKKMREHPHFSGKKITLFGHCVGGGLAAYVGLKQKVETVCLNTVGLGAGLQKEIGKQALKEADRYVTHLSTEKDWASNFPLFNILDKVVGRLFKTPGNFGKRYEIPTAYKTQQETHRYILGSILEHAGFKGKVSEIREMNADNPLIVRVNNNVNATVNI